MGLRRWWWLSVWPESGRYELVQSRWEMRSEKVVAVRTGWNFRVWKGQRVKDWKGEGKALLWVWSVVWVGHVDEWVSVVLSLCKLVSESVMNWVPKLGYWIRLYNMLQTYSGFSLAFLHIHIYRGCITWEEWFIMRVRRANLGRITIHEWSRFKII